MSNHELSFVAGQCLANADKLGGWENAEKITTAIETNNRHSLETLTSELSQQAIELCARIGEVSASWQMRG
jgi:hypothetical protein